MARIRTIKPSFFRHEQLQDLEIANPQQYVMLTFCGVWTLCDSKGRFEYKPRHIKLDILPFIEFDMCKTLDLLCSNNFIIKYEVENAVYGFIPSFLDHQRITGKESTDGEKYPEYIKGNNGETTGKHPVAQEKERSIRKGKDIPEFQENETPTGSGNSFTERAERFVIKFNALKLTHTGTEGRFKRTDDVLKKFKARIRDYKPAEIISAIEKAFKHQMHKEQNYAYLTPSYILREDILERYINANEANLESKTEVVYTERPKPIDHANRE